MSTFVIVKNKLHVADGVLYVGLFNGIGPAHTQSEMVNKGKPFAFSGIASVEACKGTNSWGQYCNERLDQLTCDGPSTEDGKPQNEKVQGIMVTCESSLCWCYGGDLSPHLFFLNVQDSSEELVLTAKNLTLGAEPISTKNNRSGRVSFTCYARNGATPTEKFDYFSDISKSPLTIKLPKLGSWYFYIVPVISHGMPGESGMHSVLRPCHSLQWEVHGCPPGKAGPDCSWERYTTEFLPMLRIPWGI